MAGTTTVPTPVEEEHTVNKPSSLLNAHLTEKEGVQAKKLEQQPSANRAMFEDLTIPIPAEEGHSVNQPGSLLKAIRGKKGKPLGR